MTTSLTKQTKSQKGAAGYILAFLLGIPLPVLLVVYLLGKC